MKKIVFLMTAFLVSLSTMMYAQDLVDSNSLTRTAAISSPPLCSDAAYVLTTSNFPSGSNLIFPSGVYYISSSITITNSNATFQDAEFIIKPGVSIIIGSGGTNSSLLTLSSCHLHGCSDMWQGIVLSNNSQLVINGSSHNPTSIIEDATTGIQYLGNEQDLSHTSIRIDNTIFNRNYVGIQISDAPILSSNTNFFRITNTLFTCRDLPYSVGRFSQVGTWLKTSTVLATTASASATYPNNPVVLSSPYINNNSYPVTSLKSPYVNSISFKGIDLNNVGTTISAGTTFNYSNLVIGNEQGNSLNRLTNIFDNQEYGIYGLNSNLTVVNCTFQNGITRLVSTIGPPIGAGICTYCNQPNSGNYQLQVVRNNINGVKNAFYDLNMCVSSSNYNNTIITNTEMYSSQTPFTMQNIRKGQTGIWTLLNSYEKVQIENNKFYNLRSAIEVSNQITNVSNPLSGNINVNNNTIALTPTTISSSTAGYVVSGISIFGSFYSIKNTFGRLNCNNNFMDNVLRGISIGSWSNKNFTCSNNVINQRYNVNTSSIGDAIYLSYNTPKITLSNLSPNVVQNNSITSDYWIYQTPQTPSCVNSYQTNGTDVRCNIVSGG